MLVTRAWILFVALCLLVACGAGEDSVSPQEAAAEVASAQCAWVDQCGQWELDCGEEAGDCSATLVDVTRAQCMAERELDDLTGADCSDLTAPERALVDDCVSGVAARPCVTQADVDAYLAALANGDEPDGPGAPAPEACAQLADVFAGCASRK